MSKQRGLGRGFDALIPTDVSLDMPASVHPAGKQSIQLVDPAAVKPNPHQPRQHFDENDLASLAASIKEHGILHPPVVSQLAEESYELIAGERRVRAAKLAGLTTIPVIVRSFEEQQKLELALLENVQRSELNPLETAAAYRKLIDEFNLSLDQVGERMGQARSTVSNLMRLLQLPPDAQSALQHGKISEAHGRAILALSEPARQAELLAYILQEGWTVRQAEAFVQAGKQGSAKSLKTAVKPAAVAEALQLASELGGYLGAKVSMSPRGKGGRLTIEYRSKEELVRIVDTIKPKQ
ncbi:MAG TPA: ParB/RepB/Spo0J family partition protein [Candidatus Saccharimonadia bacterium]